MSLKLAAAHWLLLIETPENRSIFVKFKQEHNKATDQHYPAAQVSQVPLTGQILSMGFGVLTNSQTHARVITEF